MQQTFYTNPDNEQSKDGDGNSLREVEDALTYAVHTVYDIDDKDDLYQVRLDAYGNMYNPYSVYSNTTSPKHKRLGNSHDYQKVTKEVFDLYLRFLKSYRSVYLQQAKALR